MLLAVYMKLGMTRASLSAWHFSISSMSCYSNNHCRLWMVFIRWKTTGSFFTKAHEEGPMLAIKYGCCNGMGTRLCDCVSVLKIFDGQGCRIPLWVPNYWCQDDRFGISLTLGKLLIPFLMKHAFVTERTMDVCGILLSRRIFSFFSWFWRTCKTS